MQNRFSLLIGLAAMLGSSGVLVLASDPPPPQILSLTSSNAQRKVIWAPYPAAQQYNILSVGNLGGFFSNDLSGGISGFTWTGSSAGPQRFYELAVTPMSSNALLSANVLNRLAYGPTPDEIERVLTGPGAIGPQAYIDEQLAPEAIVETGDSIVSVTTNAVSVGPATNWSFLNVTGSVSSSALFMYLGGVGEVFIDDVQLQIETTTYTTNVTVTTNGTVMTTNTTITSDVTLGTNLLVNGDFEAPLTGTGTNSWAVSANLASSSISSTVACSGSGSLHLVSTAAGTTQASSIWQQISPALPTGNNYRCVLSFRYLPNAYSGLLVVRLSGSGTRTSGLQAPPTPTWIYATATGIATANPKLYIYLTGSGEAYIDDIKLVAGSVPEAGPNLLQNGDFESTLTPPWQVTVNFTNSYISGSIAHSGNGSLKILGTNGGLANGNSVFQDQIAGVTNGGIYTVSFWYVPGGRPLTVRLAGNGTPGLMASTPDATLSGIKRRLDSIGGVSVDTGGATANVFGGAHLQDLRAWFLMNAVGSKRQLLEILNQFLENHFVTEHAKSFDYLNRYYQDFNLLDILATDWEYRENTKWRAALLNPTVTFYDLLRISAESPAMIVYLDTVDSSGNAGNIANENYAREIMELFCMGVNNGYDQHDIEAQSRAWTGWSVQIVDRANINNPFAPQSTSYGFYPGDGYNNITNIIGTWAFNYKSANHGANRAPIFSIWSASSTSTNLTSLGPKTVPARFGPPWAHTPYQLAIPMRTGTNSIQDGYDVLARLANLPFTMEFISVKLCRLFVHDDFVHGVYDYTDPNRSAEAELVRQCMAAWWGGNPKGQLRPILSTIFNSDLFRSHGGSLQKVKTPLEYTVSTIRALRSANPNGSFTASTDGYSIGGRDNGASSAPLTRMGRMMLFDRDSPDGYPESGPPWISAGTLAERIRYLQTCLMAPADAAKGDGIAGGNNNLTDAVGLLKRKLPSGSWNNAGAVVDYFLSILYPGEGKANLDLYRSLGIGFLNTADNGVTASAFNLLSSSAAVYDTRVRGMVSMLMSLQRFQEQ